MCIQYITLCIYVYIYTSLSLSIYIYICIYVYRERERENSLQFQAGGLPAFEVSISTEARETILHYAIIYVSIGYSTPLVLVIIML